MAVTIERLDALQRRQPWLGFPLAVVYKFFEDAGMHLVAALAYYGLVSAFPLLLLAGALLGLVLAHAPDLQTTLAATPLTHVPVLGHRIEAPTEATPGGAWGLLAGIAVALYGGLGAANAFQHAMNTVWAVPRNSRPNPVAARARSLALLGLLLLSFATSTVIATAAGALFEHSPVFLLLAQVLNLALGTWIWVVGIRLATAAPMTLQHVLPGAVGTQATWQAVQIAGLEWTGRFQSETVTTRSVFFLVLGLVGVLHIAALAVVLSAEVNVVRARTLYPRALMTPLTDRVDLTAADIRTYTHHALAQRFKGQQTITVEFGDKPAAVAFRHRLEQARARTRRVRHR